MSDLGICRTLSKRITTFPSNGSRLKGWPTGGRTSRSGSRGDLQNSARTSLGQRNFPEPAIRLWNNCPQAVREARSKYSAKKEIARFTKSLPL